MKQRLNVPPRLVPFVESGMACMSIRRARADLRDPQQGDAIALYAGGSMRLLGESVVENVTELLILPAFGGAHVYLGGALLEEHHTEAIARRVGFDCTDDMVRSYSQTFGLPFTGRLIVWLALLPQRFRLQ